MTTAEPRDAVAAGTARSAAGGAGGHDGEPAGRTVVDPALLPTGPERATAAETLEGVLSRPFRSLSIGIISVVVLIAFEATAVGTAMPVAARELHGVPLYAFAFSAFFTTSLFGMVAAGQWSDRSGPLASLASGIAAFAAGLGLAGAAGSMWMFVVGRAVQGLGGGLVIVALYVVVGRAYPERLRPTIMAAFAASWVVPSVVGPVAAGSVTEQFGWRWVFLAIPVLVVPPLLIALPAIRRTASGAAESAGEDERGTGAGRNRIVLALAASVGAGLLQYAGQDLRPASLLLGAAGAALLVPSALRLLPKGTYRVARGLPSVILLRGVAAGSFILAESFMPLMLVTQRGMSVTMAGLSLAGGGATWAIGSYIQSRTASQPHRERLVRWGMLLVAASIATAPAVLIPAVPVWAVAVAWCLGCLGMGSVISSTAVLLLKLSRPEEAGSNSAALQVSDGLAGIVLLGVCGAAFAALGGGVAGGVVHGATAVHIAPVAFLAVFVPAAVVALFGAFVATRLHARPVSG